MGSSRRGRTVRQSLSSRSRRSFCNETLCRGTPTTTFMDSQNKCQGFRGLTTEQEQHDDGDVWPHRLQMTNKLSTKLKKKTYHTLNQGFIWQINCSSKKEKKT